MGRWFVSLFLFWIGAAVLMYFGALALRASNSFSAVLCGIGLIVGAQVFWNISKVP